MALGKRSQKARENRLRCKAGRQGYEMRKSRLRDPDATGYGTYTLTPAKGRAKSRRLFIMTSSKLGGALGLSFFAPRRHAWGQAIRRAVLALVLVHAVLGLNVLVRVTWSRRLFGLPAPPANLVIGSPGGIAPPSVWYVADYAWIVIFVALVLGYYRTARVIALLAILPDLVWLDKMTVGGTN